MGNSAKLSGLHFGHLTVIERAGTHQKTRRALWRCCCDCGKSIITSTHALTHGFVTGCGCRKLRGMNTSHGLRHTRIYSIWKSMKQRCYNPKHKYYKYYGDRGITICNEWLHNIQTFYDWAITHGYEDDLTIDRIDNDKGYSPDNCRWTTMAEQNKNRRPLKKEVLHNHGND